MPIVLEALLCLVVGIADGDTLTARCELPGGTANVTVRLAEIDAPEKSQAWGARSKRHLSALCFQKNAVVHPRTTDRYGRTVARVDCEGTDASEEQVRAGMAWVFDRYVTDRSLYREQYEARIAARGLWADANPVTPWDWRRAERGARNAPPNG